MIRRNPNQFICTVTDPTDLVWKLILLPVACPCCVGALSFVWPMSEGAGKWVVPGECERWFARLRFGCGFSLSSARYEMPNGAKFLCKQNTFFDFIDIARWLVDDRKLTNPNLLSCEGRSAGGLLIGASINEAPELFRAAVLGVPFVDVVPTMIDASIPLTAVEFEEWGCPNEIKYFQYMMEYNPITNVKKAVYPACLLTGGLHDPRVQFWEPAKFAAELRHSTIAQSDRPICCKIDMGAGHFSASDRYKYLKEKAFDYAFILDQLGLADNQ